jgi:hypothetical protein
VIDMDEFEKQLFDNGQAIAPNGATYRVVLHGPNKLPACERTYDGESEIILGFNSVRFDSIVDAIRWAKADGRHEMSRGTPLSKRVLIGEEPAPMFEKTPAGDQAVIPGAEGRQIPTTKLQPKKRQRESLTALESGAIDDKQQSLFRRQANEL